MSLSTGIHDRDSDREGSQKEHDRNPNSKRVLDSEAVHGDNKRSKNDKEKKYQESKWIALSKSIKHLVDEVNKTNIKDTIEELFAVDLIRGRGLFCKFLMESQMRSLDRTDVFAALVAVVNTEFTKVGVLLVRRIILQLRWAYKDNKEEQLLASVTFIAHLVNQQVVHSFIANELLTMLLEEPTEDHLKAAVVFATECGSFLQKFPPRGSVLHRTFELFRGLFDEGEMDEHFRALLEKLFALQKAKFEGNPAIPTELYLVKDKDRWSRFTHEVSLFDKIRLENGLDNFKLDPQFSRHEKQYKLRKKRLLGEESEVETDEDDDGCGYAEIIFEVETESDDEDDKKSEEEMDETGENLVGLRSRIYLTILSSFNFGEVGRKLLKIIEAGQEMDLCSVLLICCSYKEGDYYRYYGRLGQLFCATDSAFKEKFAVRFFEQYDMIPNLHSSDLRNVAMFFACLLGTDALSWHVLAYIRFTDMSFRAFNTMLFQEIYKHLGVSLICKRLSHPDMEDSLNSIFFKSNNDQNHTADAIEFFISIGLRVIADFACKKVNAGSESRSESGSSLLLNRDRV